MYAITPGNAAFLESLGAWPAARGRIVIRRPGLRVGSLFALLLILLSGCATEQNCALVPLASMPLEVHHNLLLVGAGINDWGGISPLTPDFINPERPWPQVREIDRQTREFGCELRQRLPVYPEFLGLSARAGGEAAAKLLARADAEGLARSERSSSAAQALVNASGGSVASMAKATRSCA